jgi:predicted phosphodiesterase
MDDSRVAVLADIHGNRWALEAVLADIQRRGITRMVNLGDSLYGPLDPAGTADLLIPLNIPTVRGNEDRILLEPAQPDDAPSLNFARKQLAPDHLKWLKSLPITAVAFGTFFLCHGTPQQDTQYLLWEVREFGANLARPGSIEEALAAVEQPIVLCGHDHVPGTALLPSGRLVVNPGSVGLPAYSDDLPHPHVMQTATPHARYSIVFENEKGWWVENVAVPYDWGTAAAVALANGRPDWATWLRSGRAALG